MGAQSETFFCKRGHRYHDLDGYIILEEETNPLIEGCICGEKEVRSVYHYGDILDCFSGHGLGPLPKKIGTKTFRVRIPYKVYDAAGKEIEAYHDLEVEVWEVSAFFAAPPAEAPTSS